MRLPRRHYGVSATTHTRAKPAMLDTPFPTLPYHPSCTCRSCTGSYIPTPVFISGDDLPIGPQWPCQDACNSNDEPHSQALDLLLLFFAMLPKLAPTSTRGAKKARK